MPPITDPEVEIHACRELLDRLVEHLDGQTASRGRGVDSRTLSGESSPRIREVLISLRKYTGMFVRDPYYEKVCGFVRGVDWALGFSLTAGLRERVAAAGGPPHPDWDEGFPHTVLRHDPAPLRTLLTDARADVRATAALLDLITGQMDAGTDS